MEFGVFYLPAIGSKSELQAGMAGRRTDLYQRMLRNLSEQAQYLDAHGYYGIGFTEHHFHIEGEEVSTNPLMLDLYLGMQTENIRLGQLGLVLPCQNPIRVAEDTAILDQVTKGRAFVGFARGYQPRWVNTLGQHYDILADNNTDPERYEELKRELYQEHFQIIMKAWTNPTFSHSGKYWQIPPKDIFWPAHNVTREFGQGVDDKGILTEIGTVPEPYQKPHPPLFQPFSFSESSVRWAAQNNVVPLTVVCDPDICSGQFRACQEGAAEVGKSLDFGQGVGLVREVIVADTDEEAMALGRESGCFIWTKFFEPFGFNAALMRVDEDYRTIPNTFESMVERGLTICGSPDTVSRKFEAIFKKLPAEYFWLYTYNELVPHKNVMRNFELLTEKVLPNFTDKIQ